MNSLIIAGFSMIVTMGAVTYGVRELTGNSYAGAAFGIAFGWFVYQVVLSLNKIEKKQ